MTLFRTILLSLPAVLLTQFGQVAAQEQTSIDLFDTSRPNRSGLPVDAESLGMMPGTVGAVEHFNLSLAAGQNLRSAVAERRINIALPGREAVTCDLTTGEPINGIQVLRGPISGNGSRLAGCSLFVNDDGVSGDIQTSSGRYRIAPTGQGNEHSVVELLTESFPDESPVRDPGFTRQQRSERRSTPTCDVPGAGIRGTIRIMVLYTPATAARQNMDVLVAEAIAQLQDVTAMYPGDNFGVNIELAHSQQVNYAEGEELGVDLERLSGKVPGFFASIPELRDRYGADIVHLIVEGKGDSCGIGWRTSPIYIDGADWAFSVSDRGCAVGNYSFAHEIGHNLGMDHDRYVVENSSADDYNFGYVAFDAGRRTIMAYGHQCSDRNVSCPRVPTYSTPDPLFADFENVPWGRPLSANNAAYNRELLCLNAPGTAQYR